jgi:pimeloyl-ACP methyl ester carboxylesterase
MPMPKKESLILIHGVDSAGPWYKPVQRIMDVHFNCVQYSHSEYLFGINHVGKLKLALEPLGLSVFAVSILLSIFWAMWVFGLPVVSIVVLGGALLLVTSRLILTSGGLWRRFRSKLASRFDEFISAQVGLKRSHVIAHSFGTVILGMAMQKFPIRLRQLALAGTVLPRNFDWENIFAGGPATFEAVHNFTVRSDEVVWLASQLGRFSRDLGSSGQYGFEGAHTVDGVTGHGAFLRRSHGSSRRDLLKWPASEVHRDGRERDRIRTRVGTGGIPAQCRNAS